MSADRKVLSSWSTRDLKNRFIELTARLIDTRDPAYRDSIQERSDMILDILESRGERVRAPR